MGRGSKLAAVLAVVALVAGACGGKKATSGGTTSPQKKLGAGTIVCVVSDEAGFDDKSFNESAKNGVEQAVQQYGVTAKYLESKTSLDYTPNVTACLGQGAKMVVTVGFRLDKATSDAAKNNPNVNFEIVDFGYEPGSLPNVLGLTFKTDDAAFLAGYLAAGTSKTGKVGTFGGVNIPTVTIFENGFAAGVLKYKQDTRRSVQVLGWDPLKQNGTFSGDFTNQAKGKQIGEDLISEGADIILPVAGDVGLGTAAALQEAGGSGALIWVDADGCGTVPQICPLILTTVEKHMKKAVFLGIEEMLKGSFPGGTTYLGTLKNDGVGLAPFHEWDIKIPPDLKSKLDELKKGIIDGTVSVDPKTYSP